MKKIITTLIVSIVLTGCVATNNTVNAVDTVHASWYSQGRRTANGERFNPNGLTVAHRTLPFGTQVRLTNEGTGHTVVARVNDRGPFIKGRTVDVSRGVAERLGFKHKGVERLRMEVLDHGDRVCIQCQTIAY